MSPSLSDARLQFLKYLLVGGLNTAVSTAIMFSAQAAGSGLVMANATGYAIGIAVSFVLNSKFTFKTAATRESALRFLVVVFASYLCNLGTVLFTMRLTHAPNIAQLSGIPMYVVVGFIGNKYWALRGKPSRPDGQPL
jgi:putative flippase GtrA